MLPEDGYGDCGVAAWLLRESSSDDEPLRDPPGFAGCSDEAVSFHERFKRARFGFSVHDSLEIVR